MRRQVDPTDGLSADLATHLARAREGFAARMSEAGLKASDGWRIREEIRASAEKTTIILRPIHRVLDAPDLQASVEVGEDGRAKE
jgi:hypothetical protein